ncbi:MAG: phenylacetic acid degradation bifunctional protein PaaZ [Gemmatimonadales bacterium]
MLKTDVRLLASFAQGDWVEGTGQPTVLDHAVTGEPVAAASSEGLDFKGMLGYARTRGGPALRQMTFPERARMLKALATFLVERKERFYEVSAATGATQSDSWIDIEGGIGTLFAYASRGRREFPNEPFYLEGEVESLSKGGTFVGRHLCVPLEGAAVHINAFNFPCWGMLEKLSPTLLAGVPAIVKPATATSYLAEAMVREIIASDFLPDGALQLIVGGVGDLLDHLTGQDVVTITGSATTGRKLKTHPRIVAESVRFNQEADSLNFSMLGPEDGPGTEEFDLFVKEVVREMTAKAGQKCTAIRRTLVPAARVEPVIAALKKRLATATLGNPAVEGVRWGPLASRGQVEDVRSHLDQLKSAAEIVYGDPDRFEVTGADPRKGAFFPAVLLHCPNPLDRSEPHDIEAFGPVNTVMPYRSVDEAIELAKRGRGSLCGSLFTADDEVARRVVLGTAAWHGRILLVNRHCAKESTGHGSPLPHLVHGGPGRAGGGEELGGVRAVLHYMQRTAIQAHPTTLSHVTAVWVKGAATRTDQVHPFRKHFEDLQVGDSLFTARRTVTEADVVNFAAISGDRFYAHVDELAAQRSIFGRRVAHGYFVLSAAAGLFVDPEEGPVLANYGLESLRFVKPVYPGDTLRVRLTVKQKTAKETPPGGVPQGVVAWDVEVTNQNDEPVAVYTILTLIRRRES